MKPFCLLGPGGAASDWQRIWRVRPPSAEPFLQAPSRRWPTPIVNKQVTAPKLLVKTILDMPTSSSTSLYQFQVSSSRANSSVQATKIPVEGFNGSSAMAPTSR